MSSPCSLKLGIERLLSKDISLLAHQRIGLLAHQASVTSQGDHALEVLIHSQDKYKITTLFGPEHGFKTQAQDMEPVSSSQTNNDLPLYSLYGGPLASLKPTLKMLRDIDVLVIDLQDIGTRYYTYLWTTLLCMEACAASHKKVIVCDRPNPINGVTQEGPGIDHGFESFVGLHSIPVRHGKTIGELAEQLNKEKKIGCHLTVIPLEGWNRKHFLDETGLPWIHPSPNMRSVDAALLYPGMCLLEATNVSEGRGTDTPFEVFGAPYIKADLIAKKFETLKPAGISFEPCAFTPTRQKWCGEKCQGLKWTIQDRASLKPYQLGLTLIETLYQLYNGKGFEWRKEPYEFVSHIPAIDLLTGSDRFRKDLEKK